MSKFTCGTLEESFGLFSVADVDAQALLATSLLPMPTEAAALIRFELNNFAANIIE